MLSISLSLYFDGDPGGMADEDDDEAAIAAEDDDEMADEDDDEAAIAAEEDDKLKDEAAVAAEGGDAMGMTGERSSHPSTCCSSSLLLFLFPYKMTLR